MCIKNVYNCFSAEIWIIEEIRPNTNYLSDGVLGVFSTGSWRVPTIMITVDSSPIIHVYESSWIFVNRARKKRRVLVARRRGKKCCLTIIRSNIRRRILRVRVTSCVPRPAVLQTSWNVSRKKIQIFPSQILCWKYWLLARPGLQKWEKKYGRAPRGSLSVRQIDLSSPPRVYFYLFRKEVTPG